MELVPYVVAYIAIGVFVVAVVARFFMWSKMPIHMRWELYPVAHEAGRAHYGGSYLEEVDWWKQPRKVSMTDELKAMFMEILFLVALKEHNRKLWVVSFPFHFGIYLVIGCTMLMFGTAFLYAISPSIVEGWVGLVLKYLIIFCGVAGLSLGLIGALGLLQRRLGDPELRDFTAPADIFNLVFFVAAFGCALAHALVVDRDFSRAVFFVHGLLTFKMTAIQGTGSEVIFTTVTIALLGLLVAYIPLTHMSHFVGKYFSYHAIRWNDDPNTPGSEHEEPIKGVLQYPVSWSAAHIQGDGKKTWAEVATEEQKQ